MGRFDYPSPYWDPVGDPALDLIDRMLTVDVDKRITIDECLEHPWTLNRGNHINPTDSTDGLAGAMDSLDFSKRKVHRERTLLSNINDISVSKVVKVPPKEIHGQPVHKEDPAVIKIWDKNPNGKKLPVDTAKGKKKEDGNLRAAGMKEEHPAANRQEQEFMQMGGKGDMQLFADDVESRYLPSEVPDKEKK